MSVHQRKSNGTYYVAYRTAEGKKTTKTFGKGREGKRDAQRFDKQAKEQKATVVSSPEPSTAAAPGQVALRTHTTCWMWR